MAVSKNDVVRQLLEDICYLARDNDQEPWRNAPGTIEERMQIVLQHSCDALDVMSGKVSPEECGGELAHSISMRDLVASGGIAGAP